MKTRILSLLLMLTLSSGAFAGTLLQPRLKDRPTMLARYQTGVYLTANGTKLRVNIDKQLGGRVYVQFTGLNGNLYLDQTLGPLETEARLSLDLTALRDGPYWLKVSNGLEVEVRQITVTTSKPTVTRRSLTIL